VCWPGQQYTVPSVPRSFRPTGRWTRRRSTHGTIVAPRAGVPVAGAAAAQAVQEERLPWYACAGVPLQESFKTIVETVEQSLTVADGSMEERLQQQRWRSWSDRVRLVTSKRMSELRKRHLEKEQTNFLCVLKHHWPGRDVARHGRVRCRRFRVTAVGQFLMTCAPYATQASAASRLA